MPTIKEVAKAAGVSASTVSRALNGYQDISRETRERIIKTANDMGYSPNLGAKNLSTKNKKGVSILFSENKVLSEMHTENEYFFQQLMGACRFMEENNLELALYHTTSERQKTKSYDQFCEEHGIAGTICCGLSTTDRYYKEMAESRHFCVTIDYDIKCEDKPAVMTDDTQAMYELTEKILEKGYKRIVFLNGKEDTEVCAKRRTGIQKALENYGMKLDEQDILLTGFDMNVAQEVTEKFLRRTEIKEKTVFMAITDLVAIGAYRSILKAGYRLGEKIGLTGFDGTAASSYMIPPIMTVQQNPLQKGYIAAQILMNLVSGKKAGDNVYVPYTILERPSI